MPVIESTVARAMSAAKSGDVTDEPWEAPNGGDRTAEDSLIDNGPDVAPSERFGYPIFAGGKLSVAGVAAALGRARTHEPSLVPHLEKINEAIHAHEGKSRVATSADGSAQELSSTPKEPNMAPEKSSLCQAHREKMLNDLGKHKDNESMSDHDLVDAHNEEYDSMAEAGEEQKKAKKAAMEQATALSADVERLEGERDAAKQEALALSADAPRQPDHITLAMYRDNLDMVREETMRLGKLTQPESEALDKIFRDGSGNPTALALSATGPDRKPLEYAIRNWVRNLGRDVFGGKTTAGQMPGVRPMETASGNPAAMLSADGTPKVDGKAAAAATPPAEAERLRAMAGLPPRKIA